MTIIFVVFSLLQVNSTGKLERVYRMERVAALIQCMYSRCDDRLYFLIVLVENRSTQEELHYLTTQVSV